MAQYWNDKILLCKLESTYAQDPSPQGADAILATDIKLSPMEGQDLDRELELPHFGNGGTIPVDLHSKINFNVELAPSGTAGDAPAWAPLMRACGCAQTIVANTSVTYNPVTRGHESATLYIWIGDVLYAMVGTRGNVKLEVTASGIPYLRFELTGLFTLPADTSRATPNLSNFQKPQAVSDANTPTFTLGGVAMVMRKFMLDLGNGVEPRFLVGAEAIRLTDKAEKLEVTVEATSMAVFNPYQKARDADDIVVNLVHGVGAGKVSTINIPNAQMQRPDAPEGAQNVVEWSLKLSPKPVAGNDQWTLTLT